MATIITTSDLASYLRDDSATASADLLVGLANDLVTEIVGADIATAAPVVVRTTTLEVAARAWRNPNGYSSERIDDYGYSRPAETRRAGIYLTADEKAELQGLSVPLSGAYSVDLGTGPWV